MSAAGGARAIRRRIAVVAPLWIAIPPPDYGGTELVLHLLVEGLVARGHDVTLYATGGSTTSARLVPVLERPLFDLMVEGRAYDYEAYANAALVQALQHEPAYDIVHCHLGLAQLPAATMTSTPVVFTAHTVPTQDDHWVLSRFPEVTVSAISGFQASTFPVDRSVPVDVVHHGIDFEAFELGAGAGGYLAFLGRMGSHKAPRDAIRIARAAAMPLVLAGRPQSPQEIAYFNDEVKPFVDGTHVRYIGPVDARAKHELMANAAALLFPIHGDEAFGIVMIEAMACGTPVVAWNRGSVPEVIDPGVTGFVGDSIEALTDFVPLATALDRQRVRERARERFHHSRMIDDYETLYERVLRDHGSARHRLRRTTTRSGAES